MPLVFENNWCDMVDCTKSATFNSGMVYEVTLNTNTADCVCELFHKTPVYIL